MDPTAEHVHISRRRILRGSGSLVVMTVLPTRMVVGAENAWSAKASALNPQTFATLMQMARDVYPHDRLVDAVYAKIVSTFDGEANGSDADRTLFEDGIAELNRAALNSHGVEYCAVKIEAQRVELLRQVEQSPLFVRVRTRLVSDLYNDQQVWEQFGYEGESASKGGYLHRGFDDIGWLDDE